ncbi:cytochrome P450 family protein [Lentzea flava]|uniref:Cytochrome P450 n=1 Tax=Lentzea flava TaxID=103732 RepID=A0ABQ2UH41_9PSEU|nr:cytochrome P450 [Lentzea flava]MCP2198524.1 Cytochrome P450 [Lentzea flava]GGU26470.1 cytochrome P450 [Lentzea flava]
MSFFTDPTPYFDQWREQGPALIDTPDGRRAWVISRYDDVVQALGHPGLSSAVIPGGMLNHTDPPEHTQLRKPVARAFSTRRMEALRPRIERITNDLLDAWETEDEVDVIDTFAYPLPITVICELLGVPERDRNEVRTLTSELMAPETMVEAYGRFALYVQNLLETKEPGDDVITDLRDEPNLVQTLVLLITAGHETTVQLIGNGLLALLRDPAVKQRLIDDPILLPDAVDEFLRLDGPLALGVSRIATADVEIGGVTIPRSSQVTVSLGAANRDPSRYSDPDVLQLGRDPHVAFGHGIHYCVGARLARVEGEIAFGTLLRRFPELALAAEPEWRESFIRGLASFRVRPKP